MIAISFLESIILSIKLSYSSFSFFVTTTSASMISWSKPWSFRSSSVIHVSSIISWRTPTIILSCVFLSFMSPVFANASITLNGWNIYGAPALSTCPAWVFTAISIAFSMFSITMILYWLKYGLYNHCFVFPCCLQPGKWLQQKYAESLIIPSEDVDESDEESEGAECPV